MLNNLQILLQIQIIQLADYDMTKLITSFKDSFFLYTYKV